MHVSYTDEPLLYMDFYETEHLPEQLKQFIPGSEKTTGFTRGKKEKIIRIIHTIKGSSAIIWFSGVFNHSNCMKGLFYCRQIYSSLKDG